MEANLIFSQINSETLAESISDEVSKKVLEAISRQEKETAAPQVFDKYIPKTEVRGKLASSSTLWNWEKKGKLKLYAIGGKRFYKRTDIEALFTEVKRKEASNEK